MMCARNCVQLNTDASKLSLIKSSMAINEGMHPTRSLDVMGKAACWVIKGGISSRDDWPHLLIETNALSASSAFNAIAAQPFVVQSHFQATFVRQTVNNSALSLSPWIKSKILFTSERGTLFTWIIAALRNRSLTASDFNCTRCNKARQHSPCASIYIIFIFAVLQMVNARYGGRGGVALRHRVSSSIENSFAVNVHVPFLWRLANFRPEKVIVVKVTRQISH